MIRREALETARGLYDGYYGNMPVIAERLSTMTTLTRKKAKALIQDAVVGYLADLLADYSDGD